MKKELSPRTAELKDLGFNQDDILRYEELLNYRQRWGLINLERDDRVFLKKIEKSLPEIKDIKISSKKSISEKSYFKWLKFNLEEMNKMELKRKNSSDFYVWPLIIELEMALLEKLQPVLGLPDTIKAKQLVPIRVGLVNQFLKNYTPVDNSESFDFDKIINIENEQVSKSWYSLKIGINDDNYFPSYKNDDKKAFTETINTTLETFILDNFPSLSDK